MSPIRQALFPIAILLSCLSNLAFSQETGGARSSGIGNASVTLTGSWSLFQNPAGLAEINQPSLISFVAHNFDVVAFRQIGFGAIWPTKIGAVSLGLYRFGDELYSEQSVGLSYSNRFGLASLSITAKYRQFDISGIGSNGVVIFDIGGIAELTPQLWLGLHLSNINQAEIEGRTSEEQPVIARMGLSYAPTTELALSIEIEKDLDYDPTVKIGLEYEVIKSLFARTGINTDPEKFFFGLGFKHNRFDIDYALSHHQDIGQAHQISILLRIKNK